MQYVYIGRNELVALIVGLVTGGYEWMAAWCLIILASLFTPLYLRRRIYTIP